MGSNISAEYAILNYSREHHFHYHVYVFHLWRATELQRRPNLGSSSTTAIYQFYSKLLDTTFAESTDSSLGLTSY
jgi:hypothetical protein